MLCLQRMRHIQCRTEATKTTVQLTTKLAESNKAAVASAKQIEILEDHFTGLQTTSFEALELPQLEAKVAAKTGSSGIARAPLSETHTHTLSLL